MIYRGTDGYRTFYCKWYHFTFLCNLPLCSLQYSVIDNNPSLVGHLNNMLFFSRLLAHFNIIRIVCAQIGNCKSHLVFLLVT